MEQNMQVATDRVRSLPVSIQFRCKRRGGAMSACGCWTTAALGGGTIAALGRWTTADHSTNSICPVKFMQ